MIDLARISREKITDDSLDEAVAESVVAAFNGLLSKLSPEQQTLVRAKIGLPIAHNEAPRAGQVLGKILQFVPRNRPFTVKEVKQKIDEDGIQATAKAIYNALGYLTRKKVIIHIGHGRYMVDGQPVITSDVLGGAPSRDEEHDANS
jgi:hypothetical protein